MDTEAHLISYNAPSSARNLVRFASPMLGRSLTTTLDALRLPIDGPRALLSVMEELGGFAAPQHLHFGFFVISEREVLFEFYRAYGAYVSMTADKMFGVLYVSGTLMDFKNLLLSTASLRTSISKEIRRIKNLFYQEFVNLGLPLNFGKQDKSDGTYELEDLR